MFAGVDRADRPFDEDPAIFEQRNALLANRRSLSSPLRALDDAAAEVSTPEIVKLDQQIAEWKQVNATDPASRPQEIKQHIADGAIRRAALVRAALPSASVAEMDRLRVEIAAIDRQIKLLPIPRLVYAATNYF